MPQASLSPLTFSTKLFEISSNLILRLPDDVSKLLPSRGQLMVDATIHGYSFHTPLEPDGRFSHYFKIDSKLAAKLHAKNGDFVSVTILPTKVWPEPVIPQDLQTALSNSDSKVRDMWKNITPMSRWEWIRWIRATSNDETRAKRIHVACSKMAHGTRRPCCWNRNLSTEPDVSKTGVLCMPADALH